MKKLLAFSGLVLLASSGMAFSADIALSPGAYNHNSGNPDHLAAPAASSVLAYSGTKYDHSIANAHLQREMPSARATEMSLLKYSPGKYDHRNPNAHVQREMPRETVKQFVVLPSTERGG
jgi:hypothetical protein